MLALSQGVNPALGDGRGGLPDTLPAVEDNAMVIAAPAPIQSGAFHWEDQLLIRAGHSHRRPVVF